MWNDLYPNRYSAPMAVLFLPTLPFGLVSCRVNMGHSIDVNGTPSIYEYSNIAPALSRQPSIAGVFSLLFFRYSGKIT